MPHFPPVLSPTVGNKGNQDVSLRYPRPVWREFRGEGLENQCPRCRVPTPNEAGPGTYTKQIRRTLRRMGKPGLWRTGWVLVAALNNLVGDFGQLVLFRAIRQHGEGV